MQVMMKNIFKVPLYVKITMFLENNIRLLAKVSFMYIWKIFVTQKVFSNSIFILLHEYLYLFN